MRTTELADASNHSSKTALQNMVNKLVKTLVPLAVRNNSLIVNDVCPKLYINSDENSLASIIDGVLRSVINNAKESCIRISAKELYGKMIEVSVKDSNSFNTYGVACSLQDIVPMAEKIGGQLDISSYRQKITTIAFRFPI